MKILFYLIIALFFFGCAELGQGVNDRLATEINNLKTDQDHTLYLETILEEDQKVRDGAKSAEIVLKYGRDSEEDWAYTKAQWAQDSINLMKIELYLEKYGYPNKEKFGTEAALAPYLVIHHQGDLDVRNKYFEHLYKAYLKEDIGDSLFTLYLGRTYEFTFRKRLKMKNPYTSEEEIKQLATELGLTEEMKRINES